MPILVCKNFVFFTVRVLVYGCVRVCVCMCFFCSGLFKFISRSVFVQALSYLNENSLVIRQWKNYVT